LHDGLKEAHSQKVIPFLHSCLKEIIQSALDRFKALGFIQVSSYANRDGALTIFLHSPSESKEKVHEMLQKLLSLHTIYPENYQILFKEVEQCILKTQGPMPIARL